MKQQNNAASMQVNSTGHDDKSEALNVSELDHQIGTSTDLLPPQPLILQSLQQMMSHKHLNWQEISDVIKGQENIATELLTIINSPFFGVNETVDNIEDLVKLLGIKHVIELVAALSLKQAMREMNYLKIDEYLNCANDIALITAGLARELDIMNPETAYLMALFQDCGVPVLYSRFSDYSAIRQLAYASDNMSIIEVEDQNLNLNHAVIAGFICESWNLPDDICKAVLSHHHVIELLAVDSTFGSTTSEQDNIKKMVALLSLSEYIAYAYRGNAHKTGWAQHSAYVMDYLELSEASLDRIKLAMFEMSGA